MFVPYAIRIDALPESSVTELPSNDPTETPSYVPPISWGSDTWDTGSSGGGNDQDSWQNGDTSWDVDSSTPIVYVPQDDSTLIPTSWEESSYVGTDTSSDSTSSWSALQNTNVTPTVTEEIVSQLSADDLAKEQYSVSFGFYYDTNKNNRFDSGEWLAGVDVRIVKIVAWSPNSVTVNATTDATGYVATHLPAGEYVAQIADIPDGYDILAKTSWWFTVDGKDYISVIPVYNSAEVIDILPSDFLINSSFDTTSGLDVIQNNPEQTGSNPSQETDPEPQDSSFFSNLTSRIINARIPSAISQEIIAVAKTFTKYAWILLGGFTLYTFLLMYKRQWMHYVVQEGDTVDSLCFDYTMTQRAFLAKNKSVLVNGLQVGERIYVRNRQFLQKSYWNQLNEVFGDSMENIHHFKNLIKKIAKRP